MVEINPSNYSHIYNLSMLLYYTSMYEPLGSVYSAVTFL